MSSSTEGARAGCKRAVGECFRLCELEEESAER